MSTATIIVAGGQPMNDSDDTRSSDSIEDQLRRLLHAPSVDPKAFLRSTRATRLEPGTVIDGTFEIRERLGQGGMGVVYRAHHEALDRDVAIKLCRRQISERDTERLLREAQATAALAHPNIVVVHHVGTMEDQVYLVMEYVGGGTLREWLDASSRSWQRIVAKLVEAGRGLAAAHERGLVHRDFKPDNVLIGEDERARVSDFGLALALPGTAVGPGDSEATTHATLGSTSGSSTMHRAGTPRYMAPEQHAGEPVSPAADQFALCVALYEALAGEHPFEADLARPSARRRRNGIPRRVPARIRNAIERGLALAPSDRHASMSDLIELLATERRWAPALAVLGVGTLGAAAVVSVTGAPEDPCTTPLLEAPPWPDDARQRLRATFAASTLGAGETLADRVEADLDGYLGDWRRAEVEICRDRIDDAETLRARLACLSLRAVELESLLDLLETGEPEVLARSLAAVDRLTPPSHCAREELSRLARETAADDTALNEHLARAGTALSAGQVDLATEHVGAALASARDDYGRARATMMRYRVLDERKDHAAAAAEGERALQLAIRAGADEVAAEAARLLVYTAVAGLGQPETAKRWVERADAWLVRLGDPAEGRVSLDTYRALVLRDLRKHGEAEELLRDALDRARLLDPPRPKTIVSIQVDLASTLQRAGRYDEAEAQLHEALEVIETELGPDHPTRFGALQMLSATLWRAGRVEEGIERSLEVLAGYEAVYGPESSRVGAAHINLGTNLLTRGDLDGARKHTQAALGIFEAHHDLNAQDMAVRNLSQIAIAAHDLDEALVQARRDVELSKQLDDKPNVVVALVNLASIQNHREEMEAAYDTARRISELASETFDPTDPQRALAWLILGNTAKDTNRLDEARAAFETGIALLRATTGDKDPTWVFFLAGLADTHYNAGRYDDAVELLQDLDLTPMTRDEERLDATLLLAHAHLARGDRAAARKAADRARDYADAIGRVESRDAVQALLDDLPQK